MKKDNEIVQPAGEKASAGDAASKGPRRLRIAELTAAAANARSEEPEASVDPGAAPESGTPQGTEEVSKGTSETGTHGKAEGEATTSPAGDKPAEKVAEPSKPQEADGKPQPEDPMAGPDNPFWKTQLGRKISADRAQTTAEIAELRATVKLLESTVKKGATPKAEESEEDEVIREMEAAETPPGEPERKRLQEPTKADTDAEAKAQYTADYLANNKKEEFKDDPDFADIQAMMLNREDANQTYNRLWSGNPDADYRINFLNAKAELLRKRLSDPSRQTQSPVLKEETPTVPLGVGGDVKGTDTRPVRKAVDFGPEEQRYLSYIRSKGRDPEKVIGRAFAVETSGADRSARR